MSKVFPLAGKFKVTSNFGIRTPVKLPDGSVTDSSHYGIDLAPLDKKAYNVVAASEGTVIEVRKDNSFGNWVMVKHQDGTGTVYAHMASVVAKKNQVVSAGTRLGTAGSTGASTGIHLHFGVTTDPQVHAGDIRPRFKGFINPGIWYNMDYFNIEGKTFDGTSPVSSTDVTKITIETTTTTTTVSSSGSGTVRDVVPSGQYYQVTDLRGTTTDILFGRKYRVLIDLGNDQALDVSDLRCEFEIVKTWERKANQSYVTIYNLSPDTENKLIQEGQRIIIEAGYVGSQYGKIFEGNIIQPLRSKENGTDYKLTLIAMDSDRYITYGLIGVSMTAKQTARSAVYTLAQKSSVVTEVNYMPTTDIIYPRGKVLFGQSSRLMEQMAKTMNATYYSNNGKVNIIPVEGLPDGEVIDLGPESGLLGTPEQYEYGIKGSALLNPRVDLDTLIHVDNTKVTNFQYTQGQAIRDLDSEGIYRVIAVTHYGDTRGSDWKTSFSAISQAGMLPGITAWKDAYIY